jgi:hypothetical protein
VRGRKTNLWLIVTRLREPLLVAVLLRTTGGSYSSPVGLQPQVLRLAVQRAAWSYLATAAHGLQVAFTIYCYTCYMPSHLLCATTRPWGKRREERHASRTQLPLISPELVWTRLLRVGSVLVHLPVAP